MFGSKKKENEISKITNEFYRYVNSEDKKKDFSELCELYNKIKRYYLNEMQSNEFSILIEKIQLEKKLGRYTGMKTNYNMTFLIGLISAVLPINIQLMGLTDEKGNLFLGLFSMAAFVISIVMVFGKDITKDKTNDIMISLCLKVLEDIEKEINENNILAKSEVAADKNGDLQMVGDASNKYNVVIDFSQIIKILNRFRSKIF